MKYLSLILLATFIAVEITTVGAKTDDIGLIENFHFPKSTNAQVRKNRPAGSYVTIESIATVKFPATEVVNFYERQFNSIGWLHAKQSGMPMGWFDSGEPSGYVLTKAWRNRANTKGAFLVLGYKTHSKAHPGNHLTINLQVFPLPQDSHPK